MFKFKRIILLIGLLLPIVLVLVLTSYKSKIIHDSETVSIYNLLTTEPSKERKVFTSGYLTRPQAFLYLYPTAADADHKDLTRKILVSYPYDKTN